MVSTNVIFLSFLSGISEAIKTIIKLAIIPIINGDKYSPSFKVNPYPTILIAILDNITAITPPTIDEIIPWSNPSKITILLSYLISIPIVSKVPYSFFLRRILRVIVLTTLTTPINVTIIINP